MTTPITTNVQDALSRMLSQYQGAPNLTALVTAFASQNQTLEDAANLVASGRLFYNGAAYGAQLDALGTLIGLSRNGLTDAQYYLLLMGTVSENNSNGTVPTLTDIASTVFAVAELFVKTPESPGHSNADPSGYIALGLMGQTLPQSLFALALQIVNASLPAGVGIAYVSQGSGTAGGTFAMSGKQSYVGGYGDLNNPAVGGKYASLAFTNPSV